MALGTKVVDLGAGQAPSRFVSLCKKEPPRDNATRAPDRVSLAVYENVLFSSSVPQHIESIAQRR